MFENGGELFFINAVKYPSASDFAIEKNSVVIMGRFAGRGPHRRRLWMRKPVAPLPGMLMKLGLRKIDQSEIYKQPESGRKANFIWDLIDSNAESIRDDFGLAGLEGNGKSRKDVTIIGRRQSGIY